jgi:primosomal protein N' (replication factor Y) (superfamily II helicase)
VSSSAAAYAEVLLDLPARSVDRRLTYRVPPSLHAAVVIGSRVVVPLGHRTARGFVIAITSLEPPRGESEPGLVLREVLSVVDRGPLFSAEMLDLARWIAEHTVSTLLEAVHCLAPAEIFRRRAPQRLNRPVVALADSRVEGRTGPQQARILEALRGRGEVLVDDLVREGGRTALRRLVRQGAVLLKEGPRGPQLDHPPSGKPPGPERSTGDVTPTLVWGDAGARRAWILQQIQAAVNGGGQALIVVPEIVLVSTFIRALEPAFGGAVMPFHSAMTARERQSAWQRCGSPDIRVVVGTRSALFVPLRDVRLIVVDDEHDPAYQADSAPRYHARDVARRRAALDGARLVLGSLAPSVETYAEVAAGRMACVRLPAPLRAQVALVDLREEPARGRRGLLTPPLVAAIRRHLRAGGRAVLFVIRAGYTRALLCEECGSVVRCPRCDVAMPYDGERRTVSCRICGQTNPAPGTCPRCGGVRLRGIGPGTERVEEVVRRLFPSLRIARLDRETAGEFDRIAREFAAGRIRLIVGTQVLLRAGELRPTLVGVLDADFALHLPDFRGGERTLQRLRAAAAMAVSGPRPEAVFQTRMPDHPAVRALATGDDDALYRRELETRRELGFPPFTTLARLVAAAPAREAAAGLASRLAQSSRAFGVEVLGPAPAHDRPGRMAFRWQCLLRAADPAAVRAAARAALAVPAEKGSRITVEMDPQEFH